MTNAPTDDGLKTRHAVIKKVTVVGAIVNAALSVIKIFMGYIANSQALIADGMHSLADLISDGVVLWASKHSTREADSEHPYGHGRIETLVSVLLGAFLIFVAIGLMVDAAVSLTEEGILSQPELLALFAAMFSIFANEWLFHYTRSAAKRIHSNILHANAWHHRSDAISSIIALVGIGGTMLGFPYLDAIAAIGVSLLIAKVGWDIAWRSLQELIDTGLDKGKVDEIEKTILNVDGVKEVHMLRTRLHGGQAFVDVHIQIDNPRISVSEGHHISTVVQNKLLQEVSEVNDVVVHIDPENDETSAPSEGLPLRNKVQKKLQLYWKDLELGKKIKRITLHYLDGKIQVDVELPLDLISSAVPPGKIKEDLAKLCENDPDIAGIKVLFS
ncbi:MAG: cation diffusion facilitator family transporter [Gammaproteobacteria bacterium]|nr:cation diffusion facilitator family transporter [Gammaproteobacteria bacterium]